jgi:hypothetical protein
MPDTESFYYITKLHAKQTLSYVSARQYATRLTELYRWLRIHGRRSYRQIIQSVKLYSAVCSHLLCADSTRYVVLIVSKLYWYRVACKLWSETLGINLQNSKLRISATYVDRQGKLIYKFPFTIRILIVYCYF